MSWVQNGVNQFGFYLFSFLNYQIFYLYEKIIKNKPIVLKLFTKNMFFS